MPKKLSIEISDETYERLSSFAKHYNLDVKQVIDTLLDSAGRYEVDIEQISETSGPDKSLSSALNSALGNYLTFAYFLNDVLSKVKAEGQFEVDTANITINWEDDFFTCKFDATTNDYDVSSIDVRKEEGSFNFSTYTDISLDETKDNSFDDLKEIAESMDNPFDIDECRIHVEDFGEDFCELAIDCWDESIENLPTVKQVDRVIKKILKKAKIQLQNAAP